MSRLVFDLESNGLLPELTTIHCLTTHDLDTGVTIVYNSQRKDIKYGIQELEEASEIIGHNIIDFDIRAIQKLYPRFKPKGTVTDTLVCSQLIWTDLKDRDFSFARKNPDFPKRLIGSHSLKAWGFRLSNLKSDYEGGWESWNQEMEDYCVQDVNVTVALYNKIVEKQYSEEAIRLEHDVKRIILRQSTRGFCFDERAAAILYGTLSKRKAELEDALKVSFGSWYVNKGRFTPKVNNAKNGYIAGVPFTKVESVEFNPSSRQHIGDRLMKVYGWRPTEFGANGCPTVDETTLEGLHYPEAKLLVEYLTVDKRLGQLANGSNGLLKLCKNGRIHGRVNTNGAVTGRMTHNTPNVAQTPSVRKNKAGEILFGFEGGWGYEFRDLYKPTDGWLLTGADASGLELRCLAHYMARWDGGAYGDIVLHGDIHTANQQAAELPTRNDAKTFIYAFLYGAGDAKIGSIVGSGPKRGKELKAKFLSGLPALGALLKAVQSAAEKKGYVKGLDGRLLNIRSPHAALNTLLQGAGAIVMKKALVILDDKLQQSRLVPGVDYEFVANVHDEWQIEHKEEHEEFIRTTATNAITWAGEHFGFRCRLDGEAKTGRSWAETH